MATKLQLQWVMQLIVEIVEGAQKGFSAAVHHGMTFGRKTSDVIIVDRKVSARHAHIEKTSDGNWFLIDDKSSNGVISGGRRMPRLQLQPGMRFTLGNTVFRVRQLERAQPDATTHRTDGPNLEPTLDLHQHPTHAGTRSHRSHSIVLPEDWSSTIHKWLQKNRSKFVDKNLPVTALRPPLKLKFIGGVQAKTVWEIGYGPRKVGADSFEFPIYEQDAPVLCFELIPTRKGTIFKTHDDKKVRLNNQSIATGILKNGDIITIGSTRIQVNFRDEQEA